MSHLTHEQLDGLYNTLTEQRRVLRNEIRDELLRSDDEQYNELAGQVHDTGDESVADLIADVNVVNVGRLIVELREVEAALQRFSSGAYGACEDCGVEIPLARLQAYPAARRCLVDQEKYEKSHGEEHARL